MNTFTVRDTVRELAPTLAETVVMLQYYSAAASVFNHAEAKLHAVVSGHSYSCFSLSSFFIKLLSCQKLGSNPTPNEQVERLGIATSV